LARGGFSESQKVGKREGLKRVRGKSERNEGVKSWRVKEQYEGSEGQAVSDEE
jgi:hypothetical protein